MNFKSLIKRAEDVDKEFQELQSDLAEAFEECLSADEETSPGYDSAADLAASEEDPPGETQSEASASRLTPHTQT
ncbi:MAG: hypothetical protein E5X09_02790, partial [Mesorhizobium sp.]